jgi:5-methylcytosine-specific restriction enzyme B
MAKDIRSWSRPDGIPNLIGIKKVDWSVFEYGTHIPLEFIEDFERANRGTHVNRGESHAVKLLIGGEDFDGVLVNVNREGVQVDTLQLRYDGNQKLKDLMKDRFARTYNYLLDERARRDEGSKEQIRVDDKQAEYIEFYETEEPFQYKLELIQGTSIMQVMNNGNLSKQFGQVFRNKEEAEWAFDLMKETAIKLGVTGPDDERLSIRIREGIPGLHFSFCPWLVLAFYGTKKQGPRVRFAIIEGLAENLNEYKDTSFKQDEQEPAISLYTLPLEMVKPFSDQLMRARDTTLNYIKTKFSNWNKSKYTDTHLKELAVAIFDQQIRDHVITNGIKIERRRKVWWVNQGKTLQVESKEGILWAPTQTKDGRTLYHWQTMKEVQIGDIVLSYANGAVRFVSEIMSEAIETELPDSLKGNTWEKTGYLINLRYHELNPSIDLKQFVDELLKKPIRHGPIDSTGGVKQGYLFRFTMEALAEIQKAQPETKWPEFSRVEKMEKNLNHADQGAGGDEGIHYWVMAPGPNAKYWDECLEKGIILYGADELPDLMHFKSQQEITSAIKKALKWEHNPTNDGKAAWQFVHDLKIGDFIFAKMGVKEIIGYGRVTSDYYRDESRQTYRNIRKVEWLTTGHWTIPEDRRIPLKTLTEVTKYKSFLEWILPLVQKKGSFDRKYWWLNANPKIWNFVDAPIGSTQSYTAVNEKGNKRRVYKYFQEVKEGDVVIGYVSSPNRAIVAEAVITKGLHQTGEGEVIDFRKTESFINQIPLEKLRQLPELKDSEPLINNQGSLFRLSYEHYEIIRDLIDEANPPLQPKSEVQVYTKEHAYSELFFSNDTLDKAISLLKVKKNIVLQGPPGVGKTFFAKRLAYAILGKKDDSKVQMIQFHQSYSYEDFIQGYRPTPDGHFELKNGIFYTFCRQAQLQESLKEHNEYFFIIDEINRGNLSKIFGELMMLIECDKRGREFALPLTYAQSLDDKFYIPENVHIIGTMNTADRSLAMVDYALRRRFCFVDLIPAFGESKYKDFLANAGADKSFIEELTNKIDELNKRIEKDKNLGKGFKIGHSYFCPQPSQKADLGWFKNVIISEIDPLLKEYWFDNLDEAQKAIERLLS